MRTFHRLALAFVACLGSIAADPLSALPGLQNVNISEVSGSTTTNRPLTLFAMFRWTNLTAGTRDFTTSDGELYDLYFSNADGTPNYAGGEYVSITALYTGSGSGLNIDRVWLSFNNGQPNLYANIVSSFVPGISDYVSGSEAFAVDGLAGTPTKMGQTSGSQRMRVTVGFPAPTAVPEPATWTSAAIGLILFAVAQMRRRN